MRRTNKLHGGAVVVLLIGVLDGRSAALRTAAGRATYAANGRARAPAARARTASALAGRASMVMSLKGGGDDQRWEPSPSPDLARFNPMFDRFLVQRAVQTQIYYLHELHDAPSARFLANFLEHDGIERYHGFDGLRCEPGDYIDMLLASPPTVVAVRASWGSTSWGGSPGNPYIKQRRDATHDIVVYPDRIGAALLRVRDEIAQELTHDLDLIASEDIELWRHHDEVVRSGSLDDEGAKRTLPAFDSSTLGDSTPTRRGTYDLLKKLTLHVAIKETLRGMSRKVHGDELPADHLWLEGLFAQSGFLSGDQGFGTAEQFLNGVLEKEVKLLRKQDGEFGGGTQDIIDPHAIANQIIDCRQLVARHLKAHLSTVHDGATDHLRNRLERSLNIQLNHDGMA